MRFDVITIGSATRDVFGKTRDVREAKDAKSPTGKTARFPLGAKLNLEEVEFFVGGGAINTAVTFARQGFRVAAIASVGLDPEGEHVVDKSQKYGIHCDYLAVDKKNATSYSFILSLPSGSRTVFRYKGASWRMKPSKIPHDLKARWLYVNHLAGESHRVLEPLLKKAKKQGVQIAWNPGSTQLGKRRELKKLLWYADIVFLNQEEASLLVGAPFAQRGRIFQKLDALVGGLVVMTRGPEGVEVSDGRTRWSAGVLPLKRIVDRTGAGDAFGSGFVASFMRKPGDVEAAIQFASANATGVLTEWGANHGLLERGDKPTRYGKLKITKTAG